MDFTERRVESTGAILAIVHLGIQKLASRSETVYTNFVPFFAVRTHIDFKLLVSVALKNLLFVKTARYIRKRTITKKVFKYHETVVQT